ncbi:MAG: hypothetical protein EPN14_01970 [Gallionella sp.]|nr:MAG: hypothetical protein EPN14_01970 [Gallionella sp.]
MSEQMLEVMRRRSELLSKIASQRGEAAGIGARWQAPLALADQGLAAVHFLRSNPALVAGVVALLVIRRRGVVGLAKGVWRMWKGYRLFTAFSAKLLSRR